MPKSWEYFQRHFCAVPEVGLQLDVSHMEDDEEHLTQEQQQAMFANMRRLEQGAISNPEEHRMVGHYWLRNPDLAPSTMIREEIVGTWQAIQAFTRKIMRQEVRGENNRAFSTMLLIGIGGSILGPCFAIQALKERGGLKAYFMDNTDPEGIDRIFGELGPQADQVLTIVISKSGSTVETRNGMEETRRFYEENHLDFAKHAVAITQKDSQLYHMCQQQHWLEWFPMWDWVGGRTSITSAVGLLPLALAGVDVVRFLQGARKMDDYTRKPVFQENPAARLASSWYGAVQKQEALQMIILPYKDRLELLTPYLQQLIMESLGKEKNRQGEVVHQGLAVWGRKGSSDQHSYMQQLLDGPNHFFVTFINILQAREKPSPIIADDSTSGDFLQAFLLGSREALRLRGRRSITITLPCLDAFHLGALIAFYERTVGFYAELTQINAYNQPAVELGKKSAHTFITLKNRIIQEMKKHPGQFFTVEEWTQKLQAQGKEEWVFQWLQHLAANQEQVEQKVASSGLWDDRYGWREQDAHEK